MHHNRLQTFPEIEIKSDKTAIAVGSSAFFSVPRQNGKGTQKLTDSSISDYEQNDRSGLRWHGTFYVRQNGEFVMKFIKSIFLIAALVVIAASRAVPAQIVIMLALSFLTFVGIRSLSRPQLQPCPVRRGRTRCRR